MTVCTSAPTLPFCTQSNCGVTTVSRIVGGFEAKINRFPWLVLIYIYYANADTSLPSDTKCGGAIISPDYILFAAHCVLRAIAVRVRPGIHNVNDPINEDSRLISIEFIVSHPEYDPLTESNDMALARVSPTIPFTPGKIVPICLGLNIHHVVGSEVVVAGWGVTSFQGQSSDVLREVSVNLISNEQCRTMYNSSGVTIKDTMLCTLLPDKDACQGDSGGPLIYEIQPQKFVMIGIVSFGIGCGSESYPGVYTNVTNNNYITWIRGIVGNPGC
ncbi:proclotting enzyme-like [Oratosquilla oratoria]|uniref:proclotting enzyme-like n=1 Tax=Oratosquilla oratoria TaxID=337810 RepID=UPI003F7619EE